MFNIHIQYILALSLDRLWKLLKKISYIFLYINAKIIYIYKCDENIN